MGRNKLEITADRERAFVMPPYIEEWVDKTHPARFIDAIVENLDLESLGFKKSTSTKGRPNYSNKMMLKIILYAHFCKIRTLRGIERMVHNDMGMLWLTLLKLYNNIYIILNIHTQKALLMF
ncbi:MAG: transposase [Candidatus Zixiibacteriota bacterium]